MNKWIRRTLVVLEVGGSFTGIWVLIFAQRNISHIPRQVWALSILFGLVFLFGIVAGLALTETRRLGLVLSMVYQVLQIPVLSSPLLTYSLFSGIEIRVGWWKGKAVFLTEFGARCVFSINKEYPWGVGVNLMAVGLFVWLLLCLRAQCRTPRRHPVDKSTL